MVQQHFEVGTRVFIQDHEARRFSKHQDADQITAIGIERNEAVRNGNIVFSQEFKLVVPYQQIYRDVFGIFDGNVNISMMIFCGSTASAANCGAKPANTRKSNRSLMIFGPLCKFDIHS